MQTGTLRHYLVKEFLSFGSVTTAGQSFTVYNPFKAKYILLFFLLFLPNATVFFLFMRLCCVVFVGAKGTEGFPEAVK